MTAPDQPFDTGLQAERTLLAWRRTALAVAVVSTVGIRFTAPLIGWLAVILGAFGIALALTTYHAMGARYRRMHRSLTHTARYHSNGWPHTTLAAGAILLGLAALLYIAFGAR